MGNASYTSPVTNGTYMLSSRLLNALDAEHECRLVGGHLTSYHSAEEQQDVERYFMSEGAGLSSMGASGHEAPGMRDPACCLPLPA